MKYLPFERLGKFYFSNSEDKILDKVLGKYKKIRLGVQEELDKQYSVIYIDDIDLLIIFQDDGNSIRYMETTLAIDIEGCNLQKESLSKIEEHFSVLDNSIYKDNKGLLISKKYGFIVSNEIEETDNSILMFNKNYLNETTPNVDDIKRYFLGNRKRQLKLDYIPNRGFQIESKIFNWKESRISVRNKLQKQHKNDDKIIEMAELFGGDKSHDIDQRRDIYQDLNGAKNYFFLNYDKEDKLSELEVHSGIEITVKKVELKFQIDINDCLKHFEYIGESYSETEEGKYLFKNLKMTIADSKSMGGEGNELAYFYSTNNIKHLIE